MVYTFKFVFLFAILLDLAIVMVMANAEDINVGDYIIKTPQSGVSFTNQINSFNLTAKNNHFMNQLVLKRVL